MKALEKAGYLAHARTPAFKARLQRALETIDEGYRLCKKPYVGFSAGKDSAAMLWLILERYPDASALILTGGETRILYPSLDSILAWWRERWPRLDLREIHIDHVFAEGWQDATWMEQHDSFRGEWDKYLHASDDWDGCFLGLREEESRRRKMVLRSCRMAGCSYAIWRYSENRKGASSGAYRICPLDRWTVEDVAAIIAQHDIPMLESYISDGLDARTHLRTGNAANRLGQIAELRRRDPAGYNRLIQRFPELAKWS